MTPPQFASRSGLAPAAAERSQEYGRLSVLVTAQPSRQMLDDWDRLVGATSGCDVTQLSAWGRFRRHFGFEPLYVLVFEDGVLLGGAQVLHRHIPVLGSIGYVPHGPVVADSSPLRAEVRDVLARELGRIGRSHTRMLFVQPPAGGEQTSEVLLQRGFRVSASDLVAAGSAHVDLSASEEELHRNLSKTVRRASRTWAAAGVTVRVGDDRDVGLLADLMARTARHRGFDPLPVEYVSRLYRELAPTGHALLLVGDVHGAPVAAEMHTRCGNVAKARLSGIDRSREGAQLQVIAAITWEAITRAKHNGYRWFDLGGLGDVPLRGLVDGETYDESTWDGADRFKLRYGGTAFRYPPTVEMIRPWPVRRVYDLSRSHPGGRALAHRAAERLRRGRG